MHDAGGAEGVILYEVFAFYARGVDHQQPQAALGEGHEVELDGDVALEGSVGPEVDVASALLEVHAVAGAGVEGLDEQAVGGGPGGWPSWLPWT